MAAKSDFLFLRTHSARWATVWRTECVFFIHPLPCVPEGLLVHGVFIIHYFINSQSSAESVKAGLKRSLKAEDVRGTCTIFYKMATSNSSELQVTRQNVLTMTLRFLLNNFNNITITQLQREYGLNRMKLYRILDGKTRTRCMDTYMRVFVCLLNDRRKSALATGQVSLADDIDHLLRDVTLALFGVPIDDKMTDTEQ